MRLIITRHGQTEWNIAKRTQGTTNTALNRKGKEQAKLLGDRLRGYKLDVIYTSPLDRAKTTAEIIQQRCGTKPPLYVDHDLIEVQFGVWEGLTFEEIGQKYPEHLTIWRTRPDQCAVPNAESIGSIAMRCDRFIETILQKYRTDTVLVVTHALAAKVMVCQLLQLPLSRLHTIVQENTALTVFDIYDDGLRLRVLNDTCHLNGELK